jgi:hypothetical protein
MTKIERLYVALVAVFIVTFSMGLPSTAGLLVTFIVGGNMVLAFVVWVRTSLRYPPNPKRVLPIYFIVAAFLMAHIGEEYIWNFGPRIASITGTSWSPREQAITFAILLPLVWIGGAALTAIRHPIGGFVFWFIFIAMILGEPTHYIVFPLREGGRYHYFPGMWSALIPLVPAIWGMWMMITDYRQQRAEAVGATPQPAVQAQPR